MPIVFVVEGVTGQIFRDQALTVTFALLFSLLVALTILPTLGGTLLKARPAPSGTTATRTQWLADLLMKVSGNRRRRLGVITTLAVAPLLITWSLFPQLDYLPPVKRDAVDAFHLRPVHAVEELAGIG